MLSTLLAVSWQPEIRGVVVVVLMVIVLIGGSYLVVGTNVGARLGFLIVMSALFGWMTVMAAVWWTYGIGLKGPEPSWKPADPVTIIRDASLLNAAGILDSPVEEAATPTQVAENASTQFQEEGWRLLDAADPQRGQAIAASDAILQIEAEEFAAGRAPARPVADETQPHRYIYMIRDLGAKRQPAIMITFGSGLIFVILCWLLHRRELALRENLASDKSPVKA
jgi:hypothetical protein